MLRLQGKKENAQDDKQHLGINTCAGIIELARRFTLATVFSLSVTILIDIVDATSLI